VRGGRGRPPKWPPKKEKKQTIVRMICFSVGHGCLFFSCRSVARLLPCVARETQNVSQVTCLALQIYHAGAGAGNRFNAFQSMLRQTATIRARSRDARRRGKKNPSHCGRGRDAVSSCMTHYTTSDRPRQGKCISYNTHILYNLHGRLSTIKADNDTLNYGIVQVGGSETTAAQGGATAATRP
jgi:hypothetical protein